MLFRRNWQIDEYDRHIDKIQEHVLLVNNAGNAVEQQIKIKRVYERLGYRPYGEVYLDAGIEHVDMFNKIWQTLGKFWN
jgi:predicted GNAT family N-acyltransferase